MSRITGVAVALATAAAAMTGSTVGATPRSGALAAPAGELPRTVVRGVEVTMADGDLFRVWTSRAHRVVRAKRRDAATGAWGATRVLLREDGLYCGQVDVRTAAGAVAVIAECDRGSYSVDQAPTASHALFSTDTLSWSSYELEGEAYEEPGISSDGSRAVWPEHRGYVTWGPDGFTRHLLENEGEYTTTATVADDGRVSYLYGTRVRGACAVVALTLSGDSDVLRQEIALPHGCSDSAFVNVDADTTWFGDPDAPEQRTVISRGDSSSPWAVTAIAPVDAPGLKVVDGRLDTDFFHAPGLPLVAIGSARGRRVHAQLYDQAQQSWGPTTLAYDAGARRCRWGDNWLARPLGVVAVSLVCGTRHVVLTTSEGSRWRALRMARHPYGLSPDGRYVAVPGRTRTHVISPERGVVTLPLPVSGRCDVVVPDGPDGAVLLTSARGQRGWPTVLRRSTPRGWRTLGRTSLPVFEPACVRARSSNYELPYRFDVFSRWKGYVVRVTERRDTWVARRTRS